MGVKESLTSRFPEGTHIPRSLPLPFLKPPTFLLLFPKWEKRMALGWKWTLATPLGGSRGRTRGVLQDGGLALRGR